MIHTTEIVRTEKLSNGQFSVTIRCCNNPSTDHSHTMLASVAANPETRGKSLDEARKICSELHDAAIQAEAGLTEEQFKPPVEHG